MEAGGEGIGDGVGGGPGPLKVETAEAAVDVEDLADQIEVFAFS